MHRLCGRVDRGLWEGLTGIWKQGQTIGNLVHLGATRGLGVQEEEEDVPVARVCIPAPRLPGFCTSIRAVEGARTALHSTTQELHFMRMLALLCLKLLGVQPPAPRRLT